MTTSRFSFRVVFSWARGVSRRGYIAVDLPGSREWLWPLITHSSRPVTEVPVGFLRTAGVSTISYLPCVPGCVVLWCTARKASRTVSLNSTNRASRTLVGVLATVVSAMRAASAIGHP